MKISFSIGGGKMSSLSNAVDEQALDETPQTPQITSNFFYLSCTQNGIANYNGFCPTKITKEEIDEKLSNNPQRIVSLLNYELRDNKTASDIYPPEGLANIENSIYAISVYKKEIWYDRNNNQPMEQSLWHPVALNVSERLIRDFNVGNNRYYKYAFRLVKNRIDGSMEYPASLIIPMKTNWQGWSITELHSTDDPSVFYASPKDVWKFKYNISNGAQTQNISKTQQDTLSRYPVFSHGVKNAVGGSVTCLLGREMINADYTNAEWEYKQSSSTTEHVLEWEKQPGKLQNLGGYKERLGRMDGYCNKNEEYLSATSLGFRNLTSNEAVDMLDKWREVCYSGNPKLMKDQKGQSFIIQITDPSNTTNETWERMPEEISFNWIEIDDAKNCRVIQGE